MRVGNGAQNRYRGVVAGMISGLVGQGHEVVVYDMGRVKILGCVLRADV